MSVPEVCPICRYHPSKPDCSLCETCFAQWQRNQEYDRTHPPVPNQLKTYQDPYVYDPDPAAFTAEDKEKLAGAVESWKQGPKTILPVEAISDRLHLEVRKLSPKPGDLLVLTGDSRSLPLLMQGDLRSLVPEGVTWIVLPTGFTLEKVSETQMAQAGWIRIDQPIIRE